MKCQVRFSGKNKNIISKCFVLKFYPACKVLEKKTLITYAGYEGPDQPVHLHSHQGFHKCPQWINRNCRIYQQRRPLSDCISQTARIYRLIWTIREKVGNQSRWVLFTLIYPSRLATHLLLVNWYNALYPGSKVWPQDVNPTPSSTSFWKQSNFFLFTPWW